MSLNLNSGATRRRWRAVRFRNLQGLDVAMAILAVVINAGLFILLLPMMLLLDLGFALLDPKD